MAAQVPHLGPLHRRAEAGAPVLGELPRQSRAHLPLPLVIVRQSFPAVLGAQHEVVVRPERVRLHKGAADRGEALARRGRQGQILTPPAEHVPILDVLPGTRRFGDVEIRFRELQGGAQPKIAGGRSGQGEARGLAFLEKEHHPHAVGRVAGPDFIVHRLEPSVLLKPADHLLDLRQRQRLAIGQRAVRLSIDEPLGGDGRVNPLE